VVKRLYVIYFEEKLISIREDINCVFDRDPAARNTWEVLTCYPGLHAVILHRFNHILWNLGLKWLARWFSHFSRWMTGIEIHPGATIGHRFFIDHGMGVVIGETAEIGDDCTLYHGVTLGGTSWKAGKRHPTLMNNVVVGAGAKVLGPIKLAEGVRIGSNAVVTKDVEKHATVVGVPGRVIRHHDDAQQKRHSIAQKMGFDAYGATQDAPDPVATAINKMLDHIHAMDEKMETMCGALKQFGAEIDVDKLPDLGTCSISTSASDDTDEAEKIETK
jgi:serine O-acetyltransferase